MFLDMEIKLKSVLKRELKRLNRTPAQLARELGIPKSVFHSWLEGVHPSGKNLIHLLELAKILDLSLEQLLLDKQPSSQITLFKSSFIDEQKEYTVTISKK